MTKSKNILIEAKPVNPPPNYIVLKSQNQFQHLQQSMQHSQSLDDLLQPQKASLNERKVSELRLKNEAKAKKIEELKSLSKDQRPKVMIFRQPTSTKAHSQKKFKILDSQVSKKFTNSRKMSQDLMPVINMNMKKVYSAKALISNQNIENKDGLNGSKSQLQSQQEMLKNHLEQALQEVEISENMTLYQRMMARVNNEKRRNERLQISPEVQLFQTLEGEDTQTQQVTERASQEESQEDILGPKKSKRIIEVGNTRKRINDIHQRYLQKASVGAELPPLPRNKDQKLQDTLYSEKAKFQNLKIKEIEPPFDAHTGQRYPQTTTQNPLKPLQQNEFNEISFLQMMNHLFIILKEQENLYQQQLFGNFFRKQEQENINILEQNTDIKNQTVEINKIKKIEETKEDQLQNPKQQKMRIVKVQNKKRKKGLIKMTKGKEQKKQVVESLMLEKVMMKRIQQKEEDQMLEEAGLTNAPQQLRFKFKCSK